jgi:hypothetical protein
MTSHVARLYAAAAAMLVFFLSWATVAARPWVDEPSAAASRTDPSLGVPPERAQALMQKLELARDLVGREAVEASLPAVRVVETAPVTVTSSS